MQGNQDPQNQLPPELLRRYTVVFIPRKLQKLLKLRDVSSKHVGKLVTLQVFPASHLSKQQATNGSMQCSDLKPNLLLLQGIVTHMTDVKPLVSVATYIDDDTGFEVYQIVTGK